MKLRNIISLVDSYSLHTSKETEAIKVRYVKSDGTGFNGHITTRRYLAATALATSYETTKET